MKKERQAVPYGNSKSKPALQNGTLSSKTFLTGDIHDQAPMKPSGSSSGVTLPSGQAKVHSLSTASVPSAPPEEPSTSPELSLPTYEQARVHSLSTASARPEVLNAPPEYEEVDTTISRRIIQTSFPDPVTIMEQPTPIPCASSCNVSCHHSHNDICRKCKQKQDEETAELCINLCACVFGICAMAISSAKS